VATKALATREELTRADALERICKHMACGGKLTEYCRNMNINYHDVYWWLRDKPERLSEFKKAQEMRAEWIAEDVISNLANISQMDLGDLVDDDGSIKPVGEWPEWARRSVQSLEVTKSGDSTKTSVKMPDRLKAYEMVGKWLGMFKDVKEHRHEINISDAILNASKIAKQRELEKQNAIDVEVEEVKECDTK
jgi:hypothetical protein